MKLVRLTALLLSCSGFCFAVNKDLVEMQRALEGQIQALQLSTNSKLDVLTGLVQGMQNDLRRTADQMAAVQESVNGGMAKSLAPVSGLNTKVDSMGEDVRSLKDALTDLSSRLERMDAKMTDLKNQLQIIQNPPAAPPPNGVGTTPGGTNPPLAGAGTPNAAGVPAGMSADQSYTDAMRDKQTGKLDLAYNEFQQYLTYFPNTELAANAQYNLGEISYTRGDYAGAVKSFDAVLERYPQNAKTPDAHYMKGLALLKINQRSRAAAEFRTLVQNYPHNDNAKKALAQLRALGVSAGTTTAKRR